MKVKLEKWQKYMNHPEFYVGEKYEKNIIKKLFIYYYRYLINIFYNQKLKKSSLNNYIEEYLMVLKNNPKLKTNDWIPHLDLLGLK